MTLDRDQLLTTARHERDALGRTVQYTPPDRWESDSPCDGWRVRDVLAHLAAADVAAAALLGDEEPTEVREFQKSREGATTDDWNDWSVERRRDQPIVQLGMEWGRAADLVLGRAASASDEDWNERQVGWVAGDIRLKYLLQARVCEWWVHGEDIREGGALPPRREHWPAYAVNDFAIQLIPYSLSRGGHEVAEKTVAVELDGVGGGRWRRSVTTADARAEGKPDVYIQGDGYAFASVAGGRADPDVCLYEGLLNIGGDVELAEAILRTLRSFP